MPDWIIYLMIFCGAALMIYNIYGFIHFARYFRRRRSLAKNPTIVYIPIVLLVLFFLGYVGVGIFGRPDILVAGILFGGSVFVFVIYKLLMGITKQVLEAEHLEAELQNAEEQNRLKTSFLNSISHEMRTPMNVILGLDNLALKDPDLSSQTREHLEKIGLSAKHLLGLINDILDINRLDSNDMVIREEPFSLKHTVDQMDAVIGTLCAEKGLEYQSAFSPSVHDTCIGDEMQLKHVFTSILDNAVKYTDAPGKIRFLSELVSSGEQDGKSIQRVRFTVSDTGIGMDSSFIPKLFDRFTQEDSSSTNPYGGSGLSLSVAKQIVELLNGTIQVESEKGKGSVFTIEIPLVYTVEEAAAEEAEEELPELAGKRVLIVEDIPENAEIVADLLELEDVETELAENGQEALDMFRDSEPEWYDAVLMDLRMPVMDGLEATRCIRNLDREDAKTVPIIALTANAFESDIRQSLDAGMNAHLAKPAEAEELYHTIRCFLRK